MNAKQFFYFCAGILMLAIAYGIGAHKAEAQSSGQFTGITTDIAARTTLAITSTGDVYGHQGDVQCSGNALQFVAIPGCPSGWVFMGNVLGTVSDVMPPTVVPSTFGKVKSQFRK